MPAEITPVSDAVLDELRGLDTPTVCNALEVIAPERRGYGYNVYPLVCPFPDLPPIVGYARTAVIRAMRGAEAGADEMSTRRLNYYDYVRQGPAPRISVIQDLDGKNAGYGAFWGEVNSAVHKALGCLGVITDGSVRDIPQVAPGFQMLAGSILPSHAHVHVVSFGGEINVAGMIVNDGDLIHADRHGAVVIPKHLAGKVKAAADSVADKEAVVLGVARGGDFTFDKLRAAMFGPKDIH